MPRCAPLINDLNFRRELNKMQPASQPAPPAWVKVERELGSPITQGTLELIVNEDQRATALAINNLWATGLSLEARAIVAQAYERAVGFLARCY